MTAKAKLSVSNSLPFKGGSQFLAGSLQGLAVKPQEMRGNQRFIQGLCLVVAILGLQAVPSTAARLRTLQHVNCEKGKTITLTVKQTRLNVDGQLSFNTRAYHVGNKPMVPGPVIEMIPGKSCSIKVVNALSRSGMAACLADRENMETMNMFHCPDVINLHTHGLHVSPSNDNITVGIYPGQSFTYRYNVPADHSMGTHWYHGHHHGSVSLHTMGGMAGMLLMSAHDADWKRFPVTIQALYKSSNKQKYEMVLNHIFLGAGDPVEGDMSQYSLEELASKFKGNTVPLFPTFHTGLKNFYTVNGQYQPSVTVASGSTALLRMLHAVGTRAIVMKLDRPELCEIRLLARDGVFQQGEYIQVSKLVFIQATRADYAVLCTLPPGVQAPLSINVYATAEASEIGPLWGNVHAQDTVFTIVIDKPLKKALRMPLAFVPLPAHLSDLLGEDVLVTETQVVDMDDFAINTVKFPGFNAPVESRYLYSQCLGQVYQVSLSPFVPLDVDGASVSNSSMARRLQKMKRRLDGADGDGDFEADAGLHAYHQHINHFQIEHFFGLEVEPDFFRVGEWRDTASQIVTGTMLRTRPVDYPGDIYFHCHVTQHEDMGMMALYNVQQCE